MFSSQRRRSSDELGVRSAPAQRPSQRTLTVEQEAAIRAGAGNRTLRSLAAEFGVSHETIRTVLLQQGSV
jgi:hypothetical protein